MSAGCLIQVCKNRTDVSSTGESSTREIMDNTQILNLNLCVSLILVVMCFLDNSVYKNHIFLYEVRRNLVNRGREGCIHDHVQYVLIHTS